MQITPITTVKTLQDVQALLPAIYSESSAKSLEGALKRAARLTGRRLSQIPADEKGWCDLAHGIVWAGAFRGASPGEQKESFDGFVARIVSVIRAARNHVASPVILPEVTAAWRQIENYVRKVENTFDADGQRILPNLASLSIATLKARCGEIHPSLLDTATATTALRALPSDMSEQFRASAAFFDKLIVHRDQHPAIASLLPPEPIGSLPTLRDRPLDWAQFSQDFLASRDAAIRRAIRGETAQRKDRFNGRLGSAPHAERRAARKGRRKPVRNWQAAEKDYANALSWLVRHPFPDRSEAYRLASLSDLMTPDTISRAATAYAERARGSATLKNPSETASGGTTLARLATVARLNDYPDEVLWAIEDARWDHRLNSFHQREMSASREKFVRIFERDQAAVRALVSGPVHLAAEAKALFARWGDLKTRQREEAMHLAMGAAMLALQLSRSVRTRNINDLVTEWEEADLLRPLREARPWLEIARSKTKNRRPVEGEIPERQWQVLQLWLDDGRVKWCEHHGLDVLGNPFFLPGRNGTICRQTLNHVWNKAMRRIGLPGLTPHMMRHVTATLWLAAHPGDYATVAALLCDSIKTVEKFYARGDGQAAMKLFAGVLEGLDPTLAAYLRET